MFKHLLFTTAALGMLALSVGANAQTYAAVESARVRLPNGQYLTLDSGPGHPWWRDQRVVTYDRYYYEPEERVYVVYNNSNPPRWPRLHEERQVVVIHHNVPHNKGHKNHHGNGHH